MTQETKSNFKQSALVQDVAKGQCMAHRVCTLIWASTSVVHRRLIQAMGTMCQPQICHVLPTFTLFMKIGVLRPNATLKPQHSDSFPCDHSFAPDLPRPSP